MKTHKLFFMVMLVILGGISTVNSQITDLTPTALTFYGPTGTYFGGTTGSAGSENLNLGIFNANLLTGNFNVSLGGRSYFNIPGTGQRNVLIGYQCGRFSTSLGSFNTYVGEQSGSTSSGSNNSYFGSQAGTGSGSFNNAFGNGASASTSGSYNCTFGTISTTGSSGSNNTILGSRSGGGLSTGSSNTFLGARISVPTSPILSNTIIIGDGDGNQRLYIDPNGNAGIGLTNNVIPSNRLEIKSAFTNNAMTSSGLRLTNLKNTITPVVNPSLLTNKGVLSVDLNGDVILVNDIGGGITNSCASTNFVPKTNGTTGNLTCSQIFDNGTSVGINTTGPFTYNNATNPPFSGGTVPNTGTVRLDVNGVIRTVGIFATSDKKFKKDIKSIESPLEAIQKLDGKTYFWNKDANKEMEFDNGLHSGFIAQELEKVFPHLVATDEKGNKAVNYMELIPYLVEAIKEQQTKIENLEAQISNNFRAQNQDLIELKNTKIISVSPNPSNDMITVSFNVEKSVQSAKLQVHDLNGNVISSLNINDRENNITRTLQKDNFGKGIYVVSLIVNGKSIDTKKIIFN